MDRDSLYDHMLVIEKVIKNEEYDFDFAIEIIDERGKDFCVVITTGGPHIEVSASGNEYARLHGYSGSDHIVLSGDHFDHFLDYYIDRS